MEKSAIGQTVVIAGPRAVTTKRNGRWDQPGARHTEGPKITVPLPAL